MWAPTPIDFNEIASALVQEVKKGTFALFVGNGLSRLAEPPSPSWQTLFSKPRCKEALSREAISLEDELYSGGSLLELAEALKRVDEAAWLDVLSDLKRWVEGPPSPEPSIVHKLIANLQPSVVFTTNIDKLLEPPLFKFRPTYLHGDPDRPDTWIFTSEDYLKHRNAVIQQLLAGLKKCTVALFIGYGHSADDFDIIDALRNQKKNLTTRIYSLIPKDESVGLLAFRNKTLNVLPIHYSLPKAATISERRLALGTALKDLYQATGKPIDRKFDEELESLQLKLDTDKAKCTLVIGLSSMNIISQASEDSRPEKVFPSHRRESLPRDEKSEPGGPGLVVSRILSSLNFPTALASWVADDAEGKAIWERLSQDRNAGKPLFLDFFEKQAASPPGKQTWRSYVLVHPSDGQRVFLDRTMNRDFLTLTNDTVEKIISAKFVAIYFDRFLSGRTANILAPPNHKLPDETWVFYDSGEHGDRYRPNSYNFEDKIARRNINFALCSFRFAQHYLAHTLGDAKENIIEEWMPDKSESPEQSRQLGCLLRNQVQLNLFKDYVIKGASKWLREKPPRIVIVTLHEHGCLWIDVDTGRFNHVIVPEVQGKVACSASAGDTFRAAFLAAIMVTRSNHNEVAVLLDRMDHICRFANEAAAVKTRYSLVEEAIGTIKERFDKWVREQLIS